MQTYHTNHKIFNFPKIHIITPDAQLPIVLIDDQTTVSTAMWTFRTLAYYNTGSLKQTDANDLESNSFTRTKAWPKLHCTSGTQLRYI